MGEPCSRPSTPTESSNSEPTSSNNQYKSAEYITDQSEDELDVSMESPTNSCSDQTLEPTNNVNVREKVKNDLGSDAYHTDDCLDEEEDDSKQDDKEEENGGLSDEPHQVCKLNKRIESYLMSLVEKEFEGWLCYYINGCTHIF